jgi:hypothetical protein
LPADFERDLKAGRRPQVVGFYNQQFLTAAGIASSGLSDSLASASKRAVEPLAGKLAPLFGIFLVIMLSVPFILEGLLGISFKGDVPMIVVAASLLIVGYLALGALVQLLVRDLAIGLGLTASRCRPWAISSRRISRSTASFASISWAPACGR